MELVQGVLLDPKRTRRDFRALQAKEECAFVVYLAPDGTFEAVAGDEEIDAEPTSDEDHLDKVYATVESTRPQNFGVVALEGASGSPTSETPSNGLHLGFF
ncbi:hypothetical protein CYMTET_9918 [Cymbomonas tetramitiformis]|uniref:Uncharacterized protein n=1 Tax=Cymbomonas tetramitiformis TaxID=36881 RepID=A0AAE0GQA1_9CHLO|nr:hypothetical protein CYMTET_9918 [Cymbomonas tetramitiformis]